MVATGRGSKSMVNNYDIRKTIFSRTRALRITSSSTRSVSALVKTTLEPENFNDILTTVKNVENLFGYNATVCRHHSTACELFFFCFFPPAYGLSVYNQINPSTSKAFRVE